jgi:hypothetical protein
MDASCEHLIVPGLIDSPLKLQLVLLFCRHPHLYGDAGCLTDWLRESPWAIEEALDELARADILAHIEQAGRTLYYVEPSMGIGPRLAWLAMCYDDPLQRDEIHALVHETDRERQFRACMAETEQQLVW